MGNPIGGNGAAARDARSNVDPRIAYDDLREWIEEARKLGEIKEVKGLVLAAATSAWRPRSCCTTRTRLRALRGRAGHASRAAACW